MDMSAINVILAVVTDPGVREDVDRVAAAAGLHVVHASHPPSRKAWTAAAAALVDVQAALRCAESGLPRRGRVLLVGCAAPAPADWQAAVAVGAEHVITLPEHDSVLMAQLADAADDASRDARRRGAVVAVIGGRGGAGASVFATALAHQAEDALLIDTDPWSGGIDLLLGSEKEAGLRWPDLVVQGGRLNLDALRDALPRRDGVSVLSGCRSGGDIDATPLGAVIDAGWRGGATVICDLPRRTTAAVETALDAADLVAVLSPADVRSCAAAASIARWATGINPNAGVVVRGPSPGGLRATDVAAAIGLPLLAAMRAQSGIADALERGGLRVGPRSPLLAAARRVLALVRQNPKVTAA
jgi:secretion/DNA translocation related CpaE-like protein